MSAEMMARGRICRIEEDSNNELKITIRGSETHLSDATAHIDMELSIVAPRRIFKDFRIGDRFVIKVQLAD